jgi:hypothetical protein
MGESVGEDDELNNSENDEEETKVGKSGSRRKAKSKPVPKVLSELLQD